jgi:topoisomerase-4 subunit A
LVIRSGKGSLLKETKFKVSDFVDVMGWRAVGNKLADYTKTTEMEWLGKDGETKQVTLF